MITKLSNVLSSHFEVSKDKEAWNENIRLTAFSALKICSSFGPNGAYKMVTYNRGPENIVKITRDSVFVLEELAIKYPSLLFLAEAAKMQRQEIGDGTKAFIIITSALLKGADKLVRQKVHPIKILEGYIKAAEQAIKIIDSFCANCPESIPIEVLRMLDCGREQITGKTMDLLLEASKMLTVNGMQNKDKYRVLTKLGGETSETALVKGLVIKKGKCHPNMPKTVLNPVIAITTGKIGINRLELKMPGEGPFHLGFSHETLESRRASIEVEKQQKDGAFKMLEALGVNSLFSQQPIDGYSKNRLLKMGIIAFESLSKDEIEDLCRATGANIVANLENLTSQDLGKAGSIETGKNGLESTATLKDCNFVTFIVRGSTIQALDETELLLKNAFSLLETAVLSGKSVPAGGATEIQIAQQLKAFALQFSGREQLAIEAFSEALLEIPFTLAINCGLNPDGALANLKKLHLDNPKLGITADGLFGEVGFEPKEVKTSVIRRSLEVASLILRVDQQIKSKEIVKFHKKS